MYLLYTLICCVSCIFVVYVTRLDDHERKDSYYFYFSCRPAWPLRPLSFESLGNDYDLLNV